MAYHSNESQYAESQAKIDELQKLHPTKDPIVPLLDQANQREEWAQRLQQWVAEVPKQRAHSGELKIRPRHGEVVFEYANKRVELRATPDGIQAQFIPERPSRRITVALQSELVARIERHLGIDSFA